MFSHMIEPMPYSDLEKKRANAREWARKNRAENPEQQRAADQRWRERHPGKSAEATRKWAQNNPDKIKEKERARMADPVRAEKRRARAREHQHTYRKKNPNKVLSARLEKLYGITLAQYEALEVYQGGCCAICLRPRGRTRLHVDHCHETGRVRGLLCSNCNNGIGRFLHKDSSLSRAIDYLSDPPAQKVLA